MPVTYIYNKTKIGYGTLTIIPRAGDFMQVSNGNMYRVEAVKFVFDANKYSNNVSAEIFLVDVMETTKEKLSV